MPLPLPPRVIRITPDAALYELNRLVDEHNRMAEDFLRVVLALTAHLARVRRNQAELLAENNRLLAVAQQAVWLREENEHLYYVLADIDEELRNYDSA